MLAATMTTRRRGLPIDVDRQRYWAVMLPLFRGGTRLRASLAAGRHAAIRALGLADRQALAELRERAARLEGLIARRSRG